MTELRHPNLHLSVTLEGNMLQKSYDEYLIVTKSQCDS